MFRPHHPLYLLALAGLAALLPACTPPSPPAPTYPVNLSPAWSAGQKFDYVGDFAATTNSKRVIAANELIAEERAEQKQSRSIHFEAEGEALEVFPNGQPKRIVLTVKAIEAKNEKETLTGFPAPGVKIFLDKSADGERRVTIDGPAVNDAAFDLLNPALWIEDGKYTLQEQFGPAAPVAVNGTWSGNVASLLEEAHKSYEDVASATATMKLDSAEGSGENQVFLITGELALQGVKSPLPLPFTGPVTHRSTLLLTIPAATRGLLAKKQTVTRVIRGEYTDPVSHKTITITINADSVDTHKITFR